LDLVLAPHGAQPGNLGPLVVTDADRASLIVACEANVRNGNTEISGGTLDCACVADREIKQMPPNAVRALLANQHGDRAQAEALLRGLSEKEQEVVSFEQSARFLACSHR
jgi:hypothetical protein